MSVVGLDFGSKNAVIASAGRGGVDVILNGNSQRLNPCMVGFQSSRFMGEAASPFATSNYKNTITCMKRLVGLKYSDPRAKTEMARLPFRCVESKNGGVAVQVEYSGLTSSTSTDGGDDGPIDIPVEHAAGMMVQHMGSIASKAAGDGVAVSDWVIAVPGYYTDAQKRSLLAGCEIVGIPTVLRLMHEHTAAALAYGIFKDIRKEFSVDTPTNVMFVDMGDSSYSATICTFEPGKLSVRSHQYDRELGGRDFDLIIAQWIDREFFAKYGSKVGGVHPISKPKTKLKMLSAAEKAKKTLSPAGVKLTRVNMECLLDDYDFNGTLKADEYEEMCAPLLARLEGPIQRALTEVKMTPADLSSVEIVGGATRVSCVKLRLAEILGLNKAKTNNGLSTTMNADEAVARGAALQAAILSPRFKVKSYEIIEAHQYPIEINWDHTMSAQQSEGVEANKEGVPEDDASSSNKVVMFARNSNFPVTKRVTLKRAGEFSVSAAYQGADGSTAEELAKFVVKNPSESLVKVRVNVKTDVHGIVSLSSAQMITESVEEAVAPAAPMETDNDEKKVEPSSAATTGTSESKESASNEEEVKKVKKKVIKTQLEYVESRPLQWTKKEMNEMNELEVRMANADRILRETADMRNELESYIYAMRDRVIVDLASYCTEEEKSKFSTELENSENWLYEDGFDAVKSVYAEKLKALKLMGDPMERRCTEAAGRPAAVSTLQATVERYKQWVSNAIADEKYAHISDEEKNSCHKKCDETSSWMYDMLDKQGSLLASADPVVTVGQINFKVQELINFVSPIMNKPVPKPDPEPAAEKPTPESTANEKHTDEMEVDKEEKEGTTPSAVEQAEPTPMETE